MSLENEVFGGSKSEAVLREKPAKKRAALHLKQRGRLKAASLVQGDDDRERAQISRAARVPP
jgi:hypothetical protein